MVEANAGKEQIVGRTITDETVTIDDKAYIDCTFVRCRIMFAGQGVHLDAPRFVDCKWLLDGPAGNTIGLLSALWNSPARSIAAGYLSKITGDVEGVRIMLDRASRNATG